MSGNVNQDEDVGLINRVIDKAVPAIQTYDAAGNKRSFVPFDSAVASDINLGNVANYHPIRAGHCEVEFIDYGADTPSPTDDAVDILLNTGPNAGAVKSAIVNAMRDGIIEDLKSQNSP